MHPTTGFTTFLLSIGSQAAHKISASRKKPAFFIFFSGNVDKTAFYSV